VRKILVITIDTEIDRSRDWSIANPPGFRSVLEAIPDLLTPLFSRYGARPTYLLSPEVMENDACVRCLGALANVELGTHLHGDFVHPDRTCWGEGGRYTKAMQCAYPEAVEFLKLQNLTTLFRDRFGYPPLSFRAGRFGARGHTLRCLAELGYLVDTSVTPAVDWVLPEGVARFRGAPHQPYFPDENDIRLPGALPILEVPVSIWESRIARTVRWAGLEAVLAKVPIRTFQPVWLRPSFSSERRMRQVLCNLMADCGNDTFVANMMFHSQEFIPGASPYAETERACRRLLHRVQAVLEFAAEHGFEFRRLSDVYELYAERRRQPDRCHGQAREPQGRPC
jgi:hypothetical protein